MERKRFLHVSEGLDGRGVLSGEFDPDAFEVIKTALRIAESGDVEGEPARTPAEVRADALTDTCRHLLDHQQTKPGGRHRPHLNVIIEVEDDELVGRYLNGTAMARDLVDAYLFKGALHRVLRESRSTILDMGVTARVITAALFVALATRDEHCRFPGCDRKPEWREGTTSSGSAATAPPDSTTSSIGHPHAGTGTTCSPSKRASRSIQQREVVATAGAVSGLTPVSSAGRPQAPACPPSVSSQQPERQRAAPACRVRRPVRIRYRGHDNDTHSVEQAQSRRGQSSEERRVLHAVG